MLINTTILTIILIFVGAYYLFLFIIALHTRDVEQNNLEDFFYFLIIPARNEEKVIIKTVENCLNMDYENYRVIVVDDNSSDLTPVIVNRIEKVNSKVILLNNLPENSHKGKGSVLNFAFSQIKNSIERKFVAPFNLDDDFLDRFDKDHIIIGVFDADARPSPNMLKEISIIFSNLDVDAVQTAVRISNRDNSMLSKMQDIEFLGFSRIIQKARSNFGSVGLGGNGQFTKFSSLERLGKNPWGSTLTEDFELGLRLISKGMKLYFTDKAIVEQEGVISFYALFRQRTRWLQGHFSNWKYIPSVIKSSSPLITKIDTLIYIVFVSVVFLVGLSLALTIASILKIISIKNSMLEPFFSMNFILGIAAILVYSFAFIPMFVYSIFEFYSEDNFLNRLSYVFLFALYTYIWLPAGIAGLFRIISGQNGWVKTPRVSVYEMQLNSLLLEDLPPNVIERRRFPRFVFHVIDPNYPYFLDNISKGGAKIVLPRNFNLNDELLELKNPIYGEKKGRIVWKNLHKNKLEVGLEFIE